MLVVGGVLIALFGTRQAGRRTTLEHCADEVKIGFGLPCHDPASRIAGVGAVEVEANAPDQLWQIALGETGVCAGGTAGGAVDTFLDAAKKCIAIQAVRSWMQVDDLSKSHGPLSVDAMVVPRRGCIVAGIATRWRREPTI